MPKVRITQVRSAIGNTAAHRGTLRSLGLGRVGQATVRERDAALDGKLRKVAHLVKVEESS